MNQLAEPFHLKLPTVSKHLKVLQRAGLVTQSRNAQWRPAPPGNGAAERGRGLGGTLPPDVGRPLRSALCVRPNFKRRSRHVMTSNSANPASRQVGAMTITVSWISRSSSHASSTRRARSSSKLTADARATAASSTPASPPETTLIPSLGYDENAELTSDSDRKKFGLAPRPRMPRSRRQDAPHAERASRAMPTSSTTARRVCTSADQLPVTSGYVESDTVENGRRCIAYRMDSPMADIYLVRVGALRGAQGRLARAPTATSRSRSTTSPGHEYNLDRMVAGVKDSLAYFTSALRPVPAQDPAHRRVSALFAQRRFRRVVSQHGAVQRGDRLHRQGRRPRSEGRRLPVLRHRARGRAPVVGAPGGAGQRAGRPSSSPRASPSTRR